MRVVVTENQLDRLVLEQIKRLPYRDFKNADHGVFVSILKNMGAPVTPENLGFLYAWRECENSLGVDVNWACNNPFNTTWDMDPKGIVRCSPKSLMYCTTNTKGVKSYRTIESGIAATVKTIRSRYYPRIQYALMNSEKKKWTCLDIATYVGRELDVWGTQIENVKNKCKSYLRGATPAPNIIKRKGCK